MIPPVRIYRAGELVEETLALVLSNVRTPDERRGDFAAQVAAQRVGGERLRALAARLGLAAVPAIRGGAARLRRAPGARDDRDAPERQLPLRGRDGRRRLRRRAAADRRRVDDLGSRVAPRLQRHGAAAARLDQRRRRRDALGLLLRAALPAPAGRTDERRAVPTLQLHPARGEHRERAPARRGERGQRRDLAAHRRHGLGGAQPGAPGADAGRLERHDEQPDRGRHRPAQRPALGLLRDDRRRARRRPGWARSSRRRTAI